RQKMSAFRDTVANVDTGLRELSVLPETLPPGECEVGVSIPEQLIGDSLDGFQRKLGQFDRTIRTVAEVVGEELGSPPVRDLGRGSLDFFVSVHPITAAALVAIVER